MNEILNPDGHLVKTFFGSDKDSFKDVLSGLIDESFVPSILVIKDSFDLEKNKKGGCSACRLRSLTRKYKPLLISALSETQKPE